MINLLAARYRKQISIVLFLIFYGNMAGAVYSGKELMLEAFKREVLYHGPNYSGTASSLFRSNPTSGITKMDALAATSVATAPPAEKKVNENTKQQFIGGPGQPEMSSW